jgi:hypothetical protein
MNSVLVNVPVSKLTREVLGKICYLVHHTTAGVAVGVKVGAKFEEIDAGTTAAIADFLSKHPEA